MPVVQSVMDNLVRQYGKDRGERIYYAMEASGRGPFAPGAKHHDLHLAFVQKHGLSPAPKAKKKPRRGGQGSRTTTGHSYRRKHRRR